MNPVSSMEERFHKKLIEIIVENFNNEQFSVSDLAVEMGMSRATLYRKTKAITGKTISRFITEVRLKSAMQLLKKRSGTVSEVAYSVGFNSSTYFIKCFRDHYGYSPGEVLKENFQQINSDDLSGSKKQKTRQILKFAGFILIPLIAILIFWRLNNNQAKYNIPAPATENKAALNLFYQGLSLLEVYSGSRNPARFVEAKVRFEKAVQIDSTFGDAYSRLAGIFLSYIPFNEETNKGYNYADSGKIYIDLATESNVGDKDFLLQMEAIYYLRIKNFTEALRILELRWKDTKKNYNYHYERGNYGFFMRDYNATIKHLLLYLNLKPDNKITDYDRLLKLMLIFSKAGFNNEAMEMAFRQFELINDTTKFRNWYPRIIYDCGKTTKVIEYYEAAYHRNEKGTTVFNKLLESYMLNGQSNKGMLLLNEYVAYNKNISSTALTNYLLGYYYWIGGKTALAVKNFESEIKRWEFFCKLNDSQETLTNYLTIAACYSMLKNKQGTIKSLEKLEQKTSIPYRVVLQLNKSPLFNNFRNDADFLLVKERIEAKFQNEQNKIRKYLKDYPLKFSSKTEYALIFGQNSAALQQN